eukprot:CFRG5100T1
MRCFCAAYLWATLAVFSVCAYAQTQTQTSPYTDNGKSVFRQPPGFKCKVDDSNSIRTLLECSAAPGSLSLNLNSRQIDVIKEGAFKDLIVPLIDLSNNTLETLPKNTLCGTNDGAKNVTTLILDHNELTTLEVGVFTGCDNLVDLSVQYNRKLTGVFQNGLLKDASLTLKYVRLNGHGLVQLYCGWLDGLVGLHELSLRDGAISLLVESFPKSLGANLTLLDLSYNKIHTIPKTSLLGNLTKLEKLLLRSNELVDVRSLNFDSNPKLSTLDLTLNNITVLSEGSLLGLSNLTSLRSLDLSSNHMSSIDKSVFGTTIWPYLTTLKLSNNSLTVLDADLFKGLSNVTDLLLMNNKIKTIDANAFQGMAHLIALRIRGNALSSLTQSMFATANQTLETLDLSHNGITSVANGTFADMTKIRSLDLSFNAITSLPDNTFGCCGSNLVVLRLQNNRLTSLGKRLTDALSPVRLVLFSIANNPLSCCSLQPWLDERFKSIMNSVSSPEAPDYNCTDLGVVYSTPSFSSSDDTQLSIPCTFGRYGEWSQWRCQCDAGSKVVSRLYRTRDCTLPSPAHVSKGCIASEQGRPSELGESCDCSTVEPSTATQMITSTAESETATTTIVHTETHPAPTSQPKITPTSKIIHSSQTYQSTMGAMFLAVLFATLGVSGMYWLHNWAASTGTVLSYSTLPKPLSSLSDTISNAFSSLTDGNYRSGSGSSSGGAYSPVSGSSSGSYRGSAGMDNSFSEAAERQYDRIINGP